MPISIDGKELERKYIYGKYMNEFKRNNLKIKPCYMTVLRYYMQ